MTPVLTYTDFTGRYFIPLDPKRQAALTEEIAFQQKRVFSLLFGDFYDDYNTDPAAVKYDPIRLLGLHDMLKMFVYVNFLKDNVIFTTVGAKNQDNETSVRAGKAEVRERLEQHGNDAAEVFNDIVEYMTESTDFPNYNVEKLPLKTL